MLSSQIPDELKLVSHPVGIPAFWCDACTDMVALNARITRIYYTTAVIIILSVIVSFLPRIIYGAKLRKAKRQRELANKEN